VALESLELRPPQRRARALLDRLQADAGGRTGFMVVMVITVVGVTVSSRGSLFARGAIGLAALVVVAFVTLSSSDLAAVAVIAWLVVLGFVRRFLIPFAGWSGYDPLLLMGPLAAMLILVARRGVHKPPWTAMGALVGFLFLWSVAEIFNPGAYPLLINLQGELFWAAPLLWFFVGRALTGKEHDRVQRVLLWMSLPVLADGLYQSFIGFLPFELHWLSFSGPGPAIFLANFRIRPFSTLNSPQEYGQYLAIVITLLYARLVYRPQSWRWIVPLMMVSGLALFLESSRGILLLTMLALTVQTVVRFRSLPVLLVAITFVGGIAAFANPYVEPIPTPGVTVPLVGGQQPPPASQGDVGILINHQLEGLTNPAQSTAPIHIDIIKQGFTLGLQHPVGLGAAATTIAAAKAQEGPNLGGFASSEEDIASAAVALGLPGSIALMLIVVVGTTYAIRVTWHQPSMRHLGWLGILIACLGQWLSGGLYAVSPIVLLSLGGIARMVGMAIERREHARLVAPMLATRSLTGARRRDAGTPPGGRRLRPS